METADAQADALTFDGFVVDAWPRLLRTAHLLTGDPELGADLVQDVLLRMFQRWEDLVLTDHPEAYVRAAVYNAFLDDRRKSRRRASRDTVLRLRSEPTTSSDPSDRLDLWRTLGTLSGRERAVMVLRYYEDLKEAEIAEVLGVSTGSVKSYAHSALRKLCDRVQPHTATTTRDGDPHD